SIQTFSELNESFDLLISVGGDGTILRAITFVRDFSIPIVGINTGRLGFLATIQTDEIEAAIEHILNGNYKTSERTLLSVETNPRNEGLKETNFALNEIAVSRKNTTSMITVETHLNDEYLTSYWADGLIVSTPTGSTGYSLSCAGPVITPDANSFVLTPIAPHNLNARPLVIRDDTTIQLKVDGREDQHLMSLDSRIVTLSNATIITIKKAKFKIKMVELLDESFIDTLRQKMLWGEDKRN
ncbi:MAG: NAD+ kinase, partial [Psychroserpens sp.]